MYQDTVTLFNFHKASGTWHATVLSRVDIGETNSRDHTTSGINNAETVSVIIHCKADKSVTTVDGTEKSYIGPKEYARCENPAEHITFKPEKDFLYAGIYEADEPILDDDEKYESGFYHYMNDQYDGVYMVTSSAFFGLLPHFEIGGR